VLSPAGAATGGFFRCLIALPFLACLARRERLAPLPAVTTSAVLTLQPLAAVAAAAVVLGEKPSVGQLAGGVVLLIGFAVASRR
jgi:hypothetical protein